MKPKPSMACAETIATGSGGGTSLTERAGAWGEDPARPGEPLVRRLAALVLDLDDVSPALVAGWQATVTGSPADTAFAPDLASIHRRSVMVIECRNEESAL
jgi:hypothetical protein